ncbi:fluoride efflux transporter FluC [Desulfoscipio gibsoniae]|uniref:Fluoride-specific ion channel FluC n=1 Tax=Desulfoscipio gibsoniae DSM 7213 TaxID=767817 RepID=R4KGL0_9FIRM|nr:CrcB family protein [Desulfoscipio gibsoniae]AGL00797.1 Integral membrane protein possibly involved in chromosome condensation [Desulfoscipio gibsoniae DSM 7213]
MRLFMVGLGGFLGALARYGISMVLNDRGLIPWGTLVANMLGCFMLALFLTLVLQKYSGQSYLVLAVSTGFIGSLTTFSTLSVEGVALFQSSTPLAFIYMGSTLAGGYTFVRTGYAAGQYIIATGVFKKWAGLTVGGKVND